LLARFMFFLCLTNGIIAWAQEIPSVPPAKPNATGAIVGHVLCGDTHGPARFVPVSLYLFPDSSAKNRGRIYGSLTYTGDDGSFRFEGVPPGKYIVDVRVVGYMALVSPAVWTDLQFGNPERARKAQGGLIVTEVGAYQTARLDVTVERGAAVTGTARFEDGSPAGGVDVAAVPAGMNSSGSVLWTDEPRYEAQTDDRGVFRMVGLQDGEYALAVRLWTPHKKPAISETLGSPAPGRVEIFAPGSFALRGAKAYVLTREHELTGVEITLATDQLHSVEGRVNLSGKAEGSVTLWDIRPAGFTQGTTIEPDGSFRIENVPDGEYRIRRNDAKPAGGKSGVGVTVHGGDVTNVFLP
jgi:hypothetical protein